MVFGVVQRWLWVPLLGRVVGSVVCMGCQAVVWRMQLWWLAIALVAWLAVVVGVGMLFGTVLVVVLLQ